MAIHPKISPTHFPYLATKRLQLTPLSHSDFDAVKELHTDERLLEFVPRNKAKSDQEITAFIDKIISGINERKWISWKIQKKGSDQLIGTICLWLFDQDFSRCDIGYELIHAHWGKGYIAEAAKPVLQYGFETLELDAIQAYVHEENIRSINVLKREGYQLIGQKKKELIYEIRKETSLAKQKTDNKA